MYVSANHWCVARKSTWKISCFGFKCLIWFYKNGWRCPYFSSTISFFFLSAWTQLEIVPRSPKKNNYRCHAYNCWKVSGPLAKLFSGYILQMLKHSLERRSLVWQPSVPSSSTTIPSSSWYNSQVLNVFGIDGPVGLPCQASALNELGKGHTNLTKLDL